MTNETHDETRDDKIRRLIEEALVPTKLEVINESGDHVGHEGAKSGGGHFRVIIASPQFEGKSRVAQHQMIYGALGDMMQADIHALTIEIA